VEDGETNLQMLSTGNAVIVHGRTTVWSTNTAGR
jgi:hypothetical protein